MFEKSTTFALTPNPSPKLGRGVEGEGKVDLENSLLEAID
jgi:hypothetical protein